MERKNGLPPVHPGRIIKEDILPSVGLSVSSAAKCLVMCLKLARLFGGSPELWMRLQASYDIKKVQRDKEVMKRVARIHRIQVPA